MEKGVFQFPPRGRLQWKAVDRGVRMEVPGLAVQTCREQGWLLSESLPGLPCPAVPESDVERLAFPCEDSRVKPFSSPVTGPERAHVGLGPEAGLFTTILFQADLTSF